jgi:hypothetical protein
MFRFVSALRPTRASKTYSVRVYDLFDQLASRTPHRLAKPSEDEFLFARHQPHFFSTLEPVPTIIFLITILALNRLP